MNKATFKLSDDEAELIHRIFGGTKIIEDQVQTVNTGGNVMNDLYPTECGHIVLVWEYGAAFINSLEEYENGSYQDALYNIENGCPADKTYIFPCFIWNEPLEYNSNGMV